MTAYEAFIERHASRGLLVDTNVLLLYAIGLSDPKAIPGHKRTRQFSIEDFELVSRFVAPFHRIVTTPHILAELANLANLGRQSQRQLQALIGTISGTKEFYIEKDIILRLDCFPKLGLTDAGIIELSRRDGYAVLTDDFALCGYLDAYGCDAVNLNHLRSDRLLGN